MALDREFRSLPLPLLTMVEENTQRYIIYAESVDPEEVEALTAREALEKSNAESPYRILHVIRNLDRPLNNNDLINAETMSSTLPELDINMNAAAENQTNSSST